MSRPHRCKDPIARNRKPCLPVSIAAVACSLLVAGVLFHAAPARADVILSGASFSGVYSSGAGPIGFGNTTGTPGYTLDMATGGFAATPDFLNTTQHTSNLALDLSAGSYILSGYMDYGGLDYGATSLFFDGSTTAGVSVWAAQTNSLASVPAFAADGQTLMALSGTAAGAGTLTYDNGISTLTVTNYVLASQSLISSLGVEQVSAQGSIGGSGDIGFEIAVTVTNDVSAVPEPMSMALLIPTTGALLAVRRRTMRTAR